MTGSLEHAGKKYTWWAGSSDRDSEWCVHCRHQTHGISRYVPNPLDHEGAQKLAEGLAPLVESIGGNQYMP